MTDNVGLERGDALIVGGREISEESAQFYQEAMSLLTSMENDIVNAMHGSAVGDFMNAHKELKREFDNMVAWLDEVGINLSEVNLDILRTDEENSGGFSSVPAGGGGTLPPIGA